MTTLQDIMGLITKRKIKTPTDNDYIISAAYTDTQERLKPQPKMEANLLSLGAIKKYIVSGIPIGGSQTLAQTLVIGNNTGGTNILLNNTDSIQLENNSSLRQGTYDFGQGGGVSRICGVDYEDMWQGGIRHVFDTNGLIRNSTNGFNIVPNFSFDNTLRFKVGSYWTLDNGTTYVCTDDTTGAAVWELYSSPPKYKVFTALLTQVGSSDPQTLFNGDELIVGVTYTIADEGGLYTPGDFTNVGATNNGIGTAFIATGTTPNNWGLGITLLYNDGAPVATVLDDTIGNIYFEYITVGEYTCNAPGTFIEDKTTIDIDSHGQNGNTGVIVTNTTVNGINRFTIFTDKGGLSDDMLRKTRIEIRIYK